MVDARSLRHGSTESQNDAETEPDTCEDCGRHLHRRTHPFTGETEPVTDTVERVCTIHGKVWGAKQAE